MSLVCRSFNDLLVVKIISKSMIVSLGITSYLQEFRSRVASLLKLHQCLTDLLLVQNYLVAG